MRRYFTCSICFLLLLFSCSNLLANNSTFQLLGSREGDPESIVEGVSTIHGDYSEIEVDLVVLSPT